MMCTAVWLVSGVALSSVFCPSQDPDPLPEECLSDDARAAFEGGQQKGTNLWELVVCPNAPDCCGEKLADAIARILALQQPSDALAACEFGGFLERLAGLHTEVCGAQLECCEAGKSVARLYGNGYCALAINMPASKNAPTGYLQPTTLECDASFAECCATAFLETTYYFPDGTDGPNNDACRSFVEPETWQDIHQDAQDTVCQSDAVPAPDVSAATDQ